MSAEDVTPPSRWSQLGPRVRTAVVLIVGFLIIDILAAFTCFGRWFAFLVGIAVVTIAALEVARFSRGYSPTLRILFGITIVVPVVVVGVYLSALHQCDDRISAASSLLIFVSGSLLGFLVSLGVAFSRGHEGLEKVAEVMRELPLAMTLIGIGGAALIALPLSPGGAWILLWLVVVVAVNDSAAYFIGSRVGGPKLCPAISPQKTVSGSLGGLICGAGVGTLCGALSTADTALDAALLASAVVMAAQLGDLLKSYLKRLHGVKDSGSILPGHGGVLDRMDGILAGGLVVYIWAVGAW